VYEPHCASRAGCYPEKRWECSQNVDWIGVDGLSPWETDDREAVLRYLASATQTELAELADAAAVALDEGAWQGVRTPNGGWEDGPAWDDTERAWRTAAKEFLRRYQSGDRALTEGMIRYAEWDLARELAWMRGW
jgi:hypothetical protein